MGKSLIIKGADFSQNAIEFTTNWYYHVFSDKIQEGEGEFVNARRDRGGWMFPEVNEAIKGKTVNVIKVQPVIAGRFNFYIINSSEIETLTTLPNPCSFIDIKESDIGVITEYVLSSPISIEEGEALVIGDYDENRTEATTVAFYHYDGYKNFWYLVGTTGVNHIIHHTSAYAPFDIGQRVFL